MTYTKRNLRDVEDQAATHGFGEHQEARFPRGELEAETTGLAYLRIKPGMSEAFAHKHRQAEEIVVALAGSGRIRLDDTPVELAPLDAVRVGPGLTRLLEADADGLEVIVFGPHVEADAEIVRGD